jgi:hypothetical protein
LNRTQNFQNNGFAKLWKKLWEMEVTQMQSFNFLEIIQPLAAIHMQISVLGSIVWGEYCCNGQQ